MKRSVASVLAGSVLAALSAVSGPVQSAEVRVNADQAGETATLAVHSWKDLPFRTVVPQHYDFSCGSAALATLMRYHYKIPVDEPVVFHAMWTVGDQAKIRRYGFSLLDMKRALKVRGITADGFKLSLDQIEALKLPGIALITLGRYKHFVVIKGVYGKRVLVGDPAQGLKIYSRADFEKIWNGVVFVIHAGAPSPAFNRAAEWRPWAYAPLDQALDQALDPASLAHLTGELPPIYQIRNPVPSP
jgi:hypothetical protein